MSSRHPAVQREAAQHAHARRWSYQRRWPCEIEPLQRPRRRVTNWKGPEGYWASDDDSLLDLDSVHEWVVRAELLGQGMPPAPLVTAASYSWIHSAPGALRRGWHAGRSSAASGVTDGATLCVALRCVRRPGPAGPRTPGCSWSRWPRITSTVQGLRLLLGTADAHDLYRKFGFTPISTPERLMQIWPDGPAPLP